MSSPIAVYQCRTWSDFKLTLREHLPADSGTKLSDWLFRGAADTDWNLQTSFGRRFGWSADGLKICNGLLNGFRDACSGEREIADIVDDVWEMLALGQHNELPTPALDWTESPYIAAHFAFHHALCDDPKPESVKERIQASDKWVAIWALRKNDDRGLWKTAPIAKPKSSGGSIVPFLLKKPRAKMRGKILLFDGSKLKNERLRRQRGWLTLQIGEHDPLDQFVQKQKLSEPALWKFELPMKEAAVAVADLHDMNISAKELMPDHTGRCQHAIVDVVLRHFNK